MTKLREKILIFILITLMVIALIPVDQSTYAQSDISFEVGITDVDNNSKKIEVSEIEEGITKIGLFLDDKNIQTKDVSDDLSFTVYANGTYELRGFDVNNEQKSEETIEVKTFADIIEKRNTTVINVEPQATDEAAFTIDSAGIITAYDSTKNLSHPNVDIPKTISGTKVKGLGDTLFQNKNLESLVLPEGLETIGDNAVDGNALITEIILPITLKSIGTRAFLNCKGLKELQIPEGVQSIGSSAFTYCHALETVTIPSTITTLNSAFKFCEKLESIELPSTLTKIEDGALAGSANRIKIILNGKSVNQISGGPWGAKDAQIYWTESLTGDSCYYADSSGTVYGFKPEDHLGGAVCTHTKVDIPEEINGVSTVKIQNLAFYGDTRITEVHIPGNVTEIGDRAFDGCKSIKKLTLDKGVKTLGASAFSYCEGLTSIELPETVTSLTNSEFSFCKNLIEVIFRNDMTSIGYQAFYDCSSLTNIDLPKDITTIGEGAFGRCSKLASIDIPNGVTSIANRGFISCGSLSEVKFPETLLTIGENAFNSCGNISKLDLPEKLESIGVKAFDQCRFYSMDLPGSVTTLGESAFGTMRPLGEYNKAGSVYEYYLPAGVDTSKMTITTPDVIFDASTRKVTFSTKPTKFATLKYTYNVANNTTSQDMTVNVSLVEIVHEVTFKDFNGRVLKRISKVSTGDSVVAPTSPTRVGYTFIGWDKPLTNIIKDTEITAQYKKLPTVTAEDVRVLKDSAFDPKSVIKAADADGNVISMIEITSNDVDVSTVGTYTVKYKVTDQWGGTVSGEYKVTVYESSTLTVTFKDHDGAILDTVEVESGKDVSTKVIPNRAGYIFIGWDKPLTNIIQNTVITAQYVKLPDVIVTATVTFKDYDGKILDTDVVGLGQEASTKVIPSRAGYTFIGWDKALTNIMENTTITALYKRLPTIKAEDVYLQLNDPFDPLENVEATDADGNKIEVIVVKNTVDTSKEGSYLVIVQATDKWGGSTSKQYKVIVEDGYIHRVIKDKNTGITVEGNFSKNARLIVKLTPTLAPSLSHKIKGKELINAFDVSVIGEYQGELRIKFPVDNQRDGTLIYVYHEKNDGGIESFERNANNGSVEITVDELSPFVLAKDKSQQPETGDEAPLAMYILLGLTALLLFGIELRLKKNS